MRGSRFGFRASAPVVLAIVAIVASLGTWACDSSSKHTPASSAVEDYAGVLPGETPKVVPGPDLGEATTTEPDPSTFIALPDGMQVAPDQLLIMLDPSATEADAQNVADFIGGTIGGHIAYIGVWKVIVEPLPADDLLVRLDILSLQPGVLAAAPVALEMIQAEPDCAPALADKVYAGSNSDPYEMIGVREAWQALYASRLPLASVHVGILDTAMTQDPKGPIQWEFTGVTFPRDPNTTTDLGPINGFHHVDGMLGLLTGDGQNTGIAGIASPLGSRVVVSHDVLGDTAKPGQTSKWTARDGMSYTDANLISTIHEIEAGATVINGSWGTIGVTKDYAPGAAMWKKFVTQMAKDHPNVLFVYAAGNDGGIVDGSNHYPGGIASPNVVTVGNVDNDGGRHSTSNRAERGGDGEVTLGAPGDKSVWGTGADGKIQASGGGTSSATAMISGTAVLMRSIDPTLSAAEIKTMLTESADVGDAEVGGQTLRVDLAVRAAIDGVRAKSTPALGPLTDAEIAAATQYCQITVTGKITERLTKPTGATNWDLHASVKALPAPTSLALMVENRLRGADYRQEVTAPGTVVKWKVQAPKEGVGIIVTRLDNGYWLRYRLYDTNPTATPTPTPTPIAPPGPTVDCSKLDPNSVEYFLMCTTPDPGPGESIRLPDRH